MLQFCINMFFLAIIPSSITCANILGIIPTPSLSHQTPFQPIWRELSQRGHQVTVLTTHPIGDPTLTNLTEINLNFSAQAFKNWKVFERLIEGMAPLESARVFEGLINETTTMQLQNEEVQRLLKSDQSFDVILAEVHLPPILGFVWRFKCPWIGISSYDTALQYHYVMGNPVHPAFTPDYNLKVASHEGLSFFERLSSLVFNIACVDIYLNSYLDDLSEDLKRYFGDDMPPLREIQNNISMLFISTHPMTHAIRPLQPNTIQIGTGLHIKNPEELPMVSNPMLFFF